MYSAPADPRPSWLVHAAYLCFCLLLALVLRLIGVGNEGIWWDEYHVIGHFQTNEWELALAAWRFWGADNAPLHTALAYAWYQFVWSGITGSRVLSILFSLLSIPIIYGMSLRFFSARTAIISSALLALSPYVAWHAQGIRPYSMMEPLALASCWAMLEYMHRPQRGPMAVHLIANALHLAAHPLAVFLFAVQFPFLAWHWRRNGWRQLTAWCATHLLMGLTLLAYLWQTRHLVLDEAVDHLELPSLRRFLIDLLADNATRISNEFPFPAIAAPGVWLANAPGMETALHTAVFATSAAAFAWALVHLWRPATRHRPATALLLAVAIVPALLMLALSIAWRPLYESRYVMYSATPVLLLAAAAISAIPHRKTMYACACIVLAVLAGQMALLKSGNTRAPWPAVADSIRLVETSGSKVFAKAAGPGNDELLAMTLGRSNESIEPGYSNHGLCKKVKEYLRANPGATALVVIQDEGTPETTADGFRRYFPVGNFQIETTTHPAAWWVSLHRITQSSPEAAPMLPPIPQEPLAPVLPSSPQIHQELAGALDFAIPESRLHYFLLALALFDEGYPDTALMAAEVACSLGPEFSPARLMRAVGLAFKHQDTQAWSEFEAALRDDAVWLPMFDGFMRAILVDHDLAEARRQYERIKFVGIPCRALLALLESRRP